MSQSLFRCGPPSTVLPSHRTSFTLLSTATATATLLVPGNRHYRSVKIISSANLQLGKTRKLWKIQRCWQPPSLRAFSASLPLPHFPLSITPSLCFFIASFFLLVFYFLIFHFILHTPARRFCSPPALAFIHRANYALQCVAVAIVPPAETPQLIRAVYVLSFSLYIYTLFCVFYTSVRCA